MEKSSGNGWGNLKVRSGLELRKGGVIRCHYGGPRRGGRQGSFLINPHLLTAEESDAIFIVNKAGTKVEWTACES